MDAASIGAILDLAERYAEADYHESPFVKKCRGRTLVNLFFENSTRTLTSFELAGKRLGMDVLTLPVTASSVHKGETLRDTAMTLEAMGIDALVLRHPEAGAALAVSEKVGCAVINAGDGDNEHPTQALLDALTMRRHKGRLEGLVVAICGDLKHSRVGRSNFHLLALMGARVRAVAPKEFLPDDAEELGLEVFEDLESGIGGADVVMMLRLQKERMAAADLPSPVAYFAQFGLDAERLGKAKPDAIVMHPGPINRGIEIAAEVADDSEHSVILDQIRLGVAVRMAVLDLLSGRAAD
jgi:aspartate carbamoyltransferase catalytic subunit